MESVVEQQRVGQDVKHIHESKNYVKYGEFVSQRIAQQFNTRLMTKIGQSMSELCECNVSPLDRLVASPQES